MTRDELSFEAFVVLGNALTLLTNGVREADRHRLNPPLHELERLHGMLEPVRAPEMLAEIDRLPSRDRVLLAEALTQCEQLAATEADTLLGAPSAVCDAVRHFLVFPTTEPGDSA